jgi:hypothetical protein
MLNKSYERTPIKMQKTESKGILKHCSGKQNSKPGLNSSPSRKNISFSDYEQVRQIPSRSVQKPQRPVTASKLDESLSDLMKRVERTTLEA